MWPRTTGVVAVAAFLCMAPVVPLAQQPTPAVLQQHAKEGERALAEGRYADAEKAYQTLLQLSPGTAEVHARLGLIYFQQGKFSAAIPPLREAIRLKPGLPNVDSLLAMSLSELGKYEEALPALEKAFSQSADPVLQRMAGLHLQRTYTGLGRDRDAVDVALRLSRLHPDDPEVLYHSGRLFANFAYLQTMRLAAVAPESVWLHLAAGEANESQGSTMRHSANTSRSWRSRRVGLAFISASAARFSHDRKMPRPKISSKHGKLSRKSCESIRRMPTRHMRSARCTGRRARTSGRASFSSRL